MENLDLLSVILVLVGAVMVYGARYIFKTLKVNSDQTKILILKFAGLIIAFIGFLRILDII